MPPTIAIAGITSKLARLIVAELLEKHPTVHIRGSSRDISKLPPSLKSSPRISLIQASPYDKDTLRSLIRGCQVVVCCYWADVDTMFQGQKLLIDLCEEEGVPRYIASDYTGDYRKLNLGDIPEKDPMKHVLEYIKKKERVKGVHILIGLFMETFWSYFNVLDLEGRKLRYWGTGTEQWDLTTYRDGARYVAAVAMDEQAVGFLKFRGDLKTVPEIADDFEAVYAFKPALEKCASLDGVITWDQQGPYATATKLFGTGKISLGSDLDHSRYPDIKPETMQDFLKRHSVTELAGNDEILA